MIDRQNIDRILELTDIVELVGSYVSLTRRGQNYIGLCPFHNEKTPSFSVNEARGFFKCFGCGKGGNAITFLMEVEHLDFVSAVRQLAKRVNFPLEEKELTPEELAQRSKRESMLALLSWAEKYFQKTLKTPGEGITVGLSYFRERKLRDETIAKYGLGYSPNAQDAMTEAALKAGYNLEMLEATGLTTTRNGSHYDRFRGRVIFPITTVSGRTIGFGGRALRLTEHTAKYLNSPESEVYHKSSTLYGIAQARVAIAKEDRCILVEGYLDVLSMHQLGIENVVASSGTSLTEEQARMVYRLTKRITILYDGDSAGIKAAVRGLDILLREHFRVGVVLLPGGQDPDDFAKSHTLEEVKAFLQEHEQDLITFRASLLDDELKGSPSARQAAIQEIADSIAQLPSEDMQQQYRRQAAQSLTIDEQALQVEIARARYRHKTKAIAQAVVSPKTLTRSAYSVLPPPLQYYKNDPTVYERELVALVLKYGTWPYSESSLEEGEEGELQEQSVLEYVRDSMAQDSCTFHDEKLEQLLEFYAQLTEEERPHVLARLGESPDTALFALAQALLDSFKTVSVLWSEGMPMPEASIQEVNKGLFRCMHAYKAAILEARASQLKEKIAQTTDSEALPELLEELQNISHLRKAFATITKRLKC